jgi:hypothetical protein
MSLASDELSERIRRLLPPRLVYSETRMFGGRAFLLNGNMLVCPTKSGALIVRVGEHQMAEALQRPGAEVMVMNGRSMRDFVLLSGDAIEDDEALTGWLELAEAFVSTLPPK